MALKYNRDQNTFPSFLTSLGYEFEEKNIAANKCYKLNNGAIVNLFTNGTIQVQGKSDIQLDVETKITNALKPNQKPIPTQSVSTLKSKEVFIVHGHDHTSKEQLELILHKLGISDQYILQNKTGDGLTIIEALEKKIGYGQETTRFGIVLLTPDDFGYSKKEGGEKTQPRARQNVILEMGMLLSSLGRKNVAILQKQHLELPSDTSGILYLNFNEHVREIVPKLVQHLKNAGFDISAEQLANASS